MLQLPHVLDVSLKFKPVHDFLPQKSIEDAPFILPAKDGGMMTLKEEQKWLKPQDGNPIFPKQNKNAFITGENFDQNSSVEVSPGVWMNRSEAIKAGYEVPSTT
jgi:hypothetical protein